ncbi:unnamed protein product [Adineta ricciae]|uniref:Uncharacterized protein n=1 Tax=Adineta ricciae TaxID=249248 RepID=A0A815DH33_ADIRI|nr:unnamed protein product [Adineta ricciae]
MVSKPFVCTIVFLGYFLSQCVGLGEILVTGSNPNVTGLTSNATIFRTTSLYDTPITVSLAVYQREVNDTMKETLRVVSGSTNVDSMDRCIAYGVSFRFLGQYPIIMNTETGNGGCNAILGEECAENLRLSLQKLLNPIDATACGINLDTLLNIPEGCPKNYGNGFLISSTFLDDGSFQYNNPSVANSSQTWIYEQSPPSSTGDYDEITKYFVFVYFLGRSYTSEVVDSAIACLSIYDQTIPLENFARDFANNNKLFILFVIPHFFFIFFL